MSYIYIDPFDDEDIHSSSDDECPRCKSEMNPFSIKSTESCGFLGLGSKSTIIRSCTNCGYEHRRDTNDT
jgi:DNA-directed RNA polymerase subunit M/transcription elongation factor TFIIS